MFMLYISISKPLKSQQNKKTQQKLLQLQKEEKEELPKFDKF